MTPNNKRKRGRPIGSGLKDETLLARIADLIAADPALKIAPALRRCEPKANDAYTRRIQRKWRTDGAALLAAAIGRRAPARPSHVPVGGSAPTTISQARIALQEVERFEREMYGLSSRRRPGEMIVDQIFREEREQHRRMVAIATGRTIAEDLGIQGSAAQAAREASLGIAAAMAELNGGLAARAAREAGEGFALRALREVQQGGLFADTARIDREAGLVMEHRQQLKQLGLL